MTLDLIHLKEDVMPGETEALLVARNQEGNHGTLAFTLGSTGLQLIVMWTSGLNCDHYANTLAVGITNSPNSDKFRCEKYHLRWR